MKHWVLYQPRRRADTNSFILQTEVNLKSCLQQIAVELQSLKDMLDANELSPSAYWITAMPTGAQGILRFQISQEQVFLFHGVIIRYAWDIKNDYIQI